MYYPRIEIADLSDSPQTTKFVPPSGHMVGVYNRVDSRVGFHKAPANEVVAGAMSVELNLTKGEQGVLNPIGVNCIRSFPGRGIRVWGAAHPQQRWLLALHQCTPPVHRGGRLAGYRDAVGGL
ncbi:MAG: phage tail sheath subtilisin-like domain-containing protein [Chloroflexi bacterium]|nr:phage tail sheath subtilisin-like domain-containing protein [Chloroflexota bacterium]